MAPLATAVCVVFIVWLLVRDAKRRPNLSAVTWIPTLMVFTLASRTPAQWMGETLINDQKGTLIDQLFFLGMIAVSLIIVFSRKVMWGKLFSANAAVMLFYGYFAISFLWASYPADSFIRIVKDFGTTIVVILVIFSDKNPMETLRAVYIRCACVAIPLSLLFTRYYDIGKQYDKSGFLDYNGVAGQKNSFGQMLMIFIVFLVWDHLESRTARARWPWSGMRWDRIVLLLMAAWLAKYRDQRRRSPLKHVPSPLG